MAIKHIIFDFDDTLIYSTRYYLKNMVEAAEMLGLRKPTEKEILQPADSWEDAIKTLWKEADVEKFKEKYTEIASRIEYPCVEGAVLALEKLKDKYSLYILSKRGGDLASLRIEQSGIKQEFFKKMFFYEDTEYRKPDPRTFNELFQEIERQEKSSLKLEEILSVGDNTDDMKASLGIGINFVAVLTGYYTEDDFINLGLERKNIIKSVACLPDYLLNNKGYD